MVEQGSQEQERLAEQALEVLTGLEAIARVEQAICRDAVAREPAVAEGLALAGVRAASLVNGNAVALARVAVPDASCVHHVNGAAGAGADAAFELAAGSAQEAVDHCLAAHLLSRRLGRAGVCSLAPGLARRLASVRLPGEALVSELLDAPLATIEPDARPERIVELAGSALRAVGERTTRAADVVEVVGDPQTELLLVACGAEGGLVREAVQTLTAGDVSAAAVILVLVHPLPTARLRHALGRARRIFVLESPERPSGLMERLRSLVDEKVELETLAAGDLQDLLSVVSPDLASHSQEAAATSEPAAPERRLLISPAGLWGQGAARRLATALGHLGSLELDAVTRDEGDATSLGVSGDPLGSGADLMLAADPSLLDPQGALGQLRPRSLIVTISGAEDSRALAGALSPAARSAIRDGELSLLWIQPPDSAHTGEAETDVVWALAGAALEHARAAHPQTDPVETAAQQLEGAAAVLLREGAADARRLEPEALDPKLHVHEIDFRPAVTLPRMPAPVEDEQTQARWVERIRRFHTTGEGWISATPGVGLRPAALDRLAAELRTRASHPFVLVRSEHLESPITGRALRDLLGEGIAALQEGGQAARTLSDNVDSLCELAGRHLRAGPDGVQLGTLLGAAGEELVEALGLVEEEAATVRRDLSALLQALPGGAVLDLRRDTPFRLYLGVVESVRGPRREAFSREVERLREQLRDLLELDRLRSAEGRSPGALEAALGSAASEYLDTGALSRTLSPRAGSVRLAPERRARIEEALAALDAYVGEASQLPTIVLVHRPGLDLPVPETNGRAHPDPLRAAVGLFDGIARRLTSVFRAVRTARLEVADAYRPEIHHARLAGLDWEGFTAEELMLLPVVVAITSGATLREEEQNSLSGLLRSSRPVHVLVLDEAASPDEAADLSRFHVDLGSLVVAHREAFAVGTTLARPAPFVDALVRMAQALRPAVALVRMPGLDLPHWSALRAEAALHGRVCPDFRYDPDAGSSWADRFSLAGNPDPERPWPACAVSYLEEGEERALESAFTFADAVAAEPAYQRHLRVAPPVAWDEAWQPLAEYLESFSPGSRERVIPYVWVIDDAGMLQRAVVTRALALACHDRLRAWRSLQELAGFDNVFAERAAAAAREQALAEAAAQAAELEQSHAEELERIRNETARESLERLAAVLMRPEGAGLAALPLPGAAPAAAAGVAPAEAPPVAEVAAVPAEPAPVAEEAPAEEEALAFDEPYIDTPLCTSCNECTNINARLFLYNGDKQAYIEDASVGTFEELVKAAELCPARCIHPGKPRADDSTGTPEMIERAAKFN